MPQRTIYIPEDLIPILDKAQKEFGEGEGLGSLMVKALKEKLDNLPKIKKIALDLQLIRRTGIPILSELVDCGPTEIPEIIFSKAGFKAELAYMADPDHFDLYEIADKKIGITDFLHTICLEGDGIATARRHLEEWGWFEKAYDLIEVGKRKYKKDVSNFLEKAEKEGKLEKEVIEEIENDLKNY